jgi:hypothetical protein
MSNYDKILREKENYRPLGNTDMEKNWAAMETQLNSATQATSRDAKFNFKKIIKGLIVAAVACIIGFVVFTKPKNKEKVNVNVAQLSSAIKPPMPAINVPYETFTYDAEIGDTLFTKNGSIIIFPKNAVLNNKGEIIIGKVEVRTREFNDPLDYYMAGIPMTYDSAGVKYTFISSGMIDIKAYSNNELLKVNPTAKPQLNLVSTNNEKNTNLYILDTATGQWINKGKDEVNDLAKNSNQKNTINTALVPEKPIKKDLMVSVEKLKPEKDTSVKSMLLKKVSNKYPTVKDVVNKSTPKPKPTLEKKETKAVADYPTVSKGEVISSEESTKRKAFITKPIIPEKASGKNPTIEIIIDPASFKELLAYNNLKFEVLDSKTETVGENSKTEWDNVELIRIGDKGYIAKFSRGQTMVQYKVKPVLEGKDYEDALKVYDNKIKEYYDTQKARVTNEQTEQNTIALNDTLIDEENKKTVAKNEIVIAKNKITEIENKRIAELNGLIIARNKAIKEAKGRNDLLRLIWEKDNKALALKENLLRSFSIDGFGYWNCDQPTYPSGVPISATFVDSKNNILNFNYINAASFGVNRVLAYYNNNITVLPNINHIIWSVYQNEFYYLTFKEYGKLDMQPETRTYTFKLAKYEGDANSLSDLKKILYGG